MGETDRAVVFEELVSITDAISGLDGADTLDTRKLDEAVAFFTSGINTLQTDDVAKIGDVGYESLAAAAAVVKSGETIVLLKNCSGNGIVVPSGSNFTIDFGGYTYTIDGSTVGSSGTETNGFQLLKNSTIVMKNGTITSDKAKILIQNYSNLTLENMTLDGTNLAGSGNYTLSNNYGDIYITGNTSILAAPGDYAFDVCFWKSGGYDSVHVTVNTTGTISGNIEYTAPGATDEEAAAKSSLEIKNVVHNGALNVATKGAKVSVSGGSFSYPVPAEYCADGFAPVNLGNGSYGVQQQNSVTVSYDANGGSGAPASETKTVATGTQAEFTIPATKPTRQDYIFMGWSTSKDGPIQYQPGGKLSTAVSLTLYAVWKDASYKTFTLTFDPNGGAGGPGSQSVETNTGSGIIVINRIRPYRLGYYFSGWSLTRDGKTQYRPGDSITIQGDLTLYAVWASPTDSPRTGDESHIGLWAAIAGLSLVAIGAGAFVLYRKNRLAK